MAKKYLDYDGLLYFWQKIKANFVTDVTYNSTSKKIQKTKAGSASDVVTLSMVATSGSYNDLSNKPTIPEGVEKTTTTPLMDGTAAIGSETKFAAGDHVHPSDTTKADKSDTVSNVNWSSSSKKITKTINGTTSDVVTVQGIKEAIGAPSSTSGSGLMSYSQYTKLDGIASGAEVNQNAFSNVKVGSTTIAADAKTDTLELVAGSNVTLTPDATNDTVTIAATDTTYSDATSSTHGLMSTTDKAYLSSMQSAVNDPEDFEDMLTLNSTMTNYIGVALPSSGSEMRVPKLDSNNLIPTAVLPSYVDDVIEAYPRSGQTELSQNWLATGSASGTVITPEAGKIYILMADSTSYAANSQFRWGGTTYVKMNDGGVSSITNAEIDTIVAS